MMSDTYSIFEDQMNQLYTPQDNLQWYHRLVGKRSRCRQRHRARDMECYWLGCRKYNRY